MEYKRICLQFCKASLIFVLSAEGFAKSASEVFESASESVVVVYAYDSNARHKSLGSGVILPSDTVVTNCHVIENSDRIFVRYHQREYAAKIKDTDYDRDVCSLAVSNLKAPAVKLRSTKNLKVGQRVYAIGAPSGLELTLSEGIVSSLRDLEGGRYIQTTAPISPGSSGGGLFDEEGLLVGMPTFYLVEGQQLNFAVPVEWIIELPQRHRHSKKTEKSTLEWINKASELERRKDWPAFLQHAQNWTNNSPYESMAWYSLGLAYVRSGETVKAIEAYQRGLRINPDNDFVWFNLGVTYDEANQYDMAIEAYRQALRINPEYDNAWFGLGNSYIGSHQIDKAIEAYQQALRINPEDADYWYGIGLAYSKNNLNTEAIEAYQHALQINLDYYKAWFYLGSSYIKNHQVDKAIEAYQQALRVKPKDDKALFNLGIAYKIKGQKSRVDEVYEQLKNISPQVADKFFAKIVQP